MLFLEANQAALGDEHSYAEATQQRRYDRLTEAKTAPVPSTTLDRSASH